MIPSIAIEVQPFSRSSSESDVAVAPLLARATSSLRTFTGARKHTGTSNSPLSSLMHSVQRSTAVSTSSASRVIAAPKARLCPGATVPLSDVGRAESASPVLHSTLTSRGPSVPLVKVSSTGIVWPRSRMGSCPKLSAATQSRKW